MLFTAGNLMPAQVLSQPLFQIYKRIPLPDFLSDTDTGNLLGTKIAVIIIHVAFQVGFCTFVLSQLHEDDAQRALRGSRHRRRRRCPVSFSR